LATILEVWSCWIHSWVFYQCMVLWDGMESNRI